MSVFNIHLESNLEEDFSQHLTYNAELKELYGEINTPFSFIDKMLSIIPSNNFSNKHYKWLDAGSGHGNYSLCLYFCLFKCLKEVIPNEEERKEHIIKNIIYFIFLITNDRI